jgi:integrase
MATIQERNGSFRILFCHGDKRLSFTAGRISRTQAQAHAEKVEELLALLADGTLTLPEGVDLVTFVLYKGKPPAPKPKPTSQDTGVPPPGAPLPLSAYVDRYLEARSGGSMEANSLATARMHFRHLLRTLGADFDLRKCMLADLQRHVNARCKEGDRRHKESRPVAAATIRLEVSSLRSAWNWGVAGGLLAGNFPSRGLLYPKAEEQPPFMTWEEVERRVKAQGAEDGPWDCLYLRKGEVAELVAHVAGKDAAPWLHPLVATAAYTGARRSELLRMETADVDLVANVVLIREKKRTRKQRTTRRVSLTPALADVLKAWLDVHPGGKYLFCQSGIVGRSTKRSATTGHRGEGKRESSLKGRLKGVKGRPQAPTEAVTKDEAHDHFRRAVRGSKWEVLKGYHVLRHSFISCLAAAGVDQRIIDDWTGHSTDEQRRRYRHLVPDLKQQAMTNVFG